MFLYFQVQYEISLGLKTSNLPREKWDTWDPTLISEVNNHQLNSLINLNKAFIPGPIHKLSFADWPIIGHPFTIATQCIMFIY